MAKMAKKRKTGEAKEGGDAEPQTPQSESANAAARKKPAQSRIGRACDRCQHRKLACDSTPHSCQQCQKASTWCTTTDPLTGIPAYRGEFDYLTRRVENQHKDIKELLSRLRALGHDVSSYDGQDNETKRYDAWTRAQVMSDSKPWEQEDKQANHTRDLVLQSANDPTNNSVRSSSTLSAGQNQSPPMTANNTNANVKADPSGRNFVGISISNDPLQDKPGTRLNILRWELDIADLTGERDDEFDELPSSRHPLFDRSYRSFIATSTGLQDKPQPPKLPTRQKAFGYALQYLHINSSFMPVVHIASFMDLITRFYDDGNFQPTTGELVCIHACFASVFFQAASRNTSGQELPPELQGNPDIPHYQYCLAFWPQLMKGTTLQDMQALALLCSHTRNFPKPEVGWAIMVLTFNRLIQLEYHRSASAGHSWATGMSFLEKEMRKRIFWSVLTILVTANGKLGRPMPIRFEDFDVEIPFAINDEQITENGLDESKKDSCHFLIGIEAFKLLPIFLDLYNTLYAARKPCVNPVEFVQNAEKKLQKWIDEWPAELQSDPTNPRTNVLHQYLRSWSQEYRLLLYHPSLSLTHDAEFNERNLRKCMNAANQMLDLATILKDYKTLDTTWFNCAIYILAIQTTLWGHLQFKNDLNPEKLNSIRADMDAWLSIMGEIGALLGTGHKLKRTIGQQVERGLMSLGEHIGIHKGSPSRADTESPSLTQPLSTTFTPQSTNYGNTGFAQLSNSQTHGSMYGQQNTFPSAIHLNSNRNLSSLESYGFRSGSASSFDRAIGPYSDQQPMSIENHHSQQSFDQQTGQPSTQRIVNGLYVPSGVTSSADFPGTGVYGPNSNSWIQYTLQLNPRSENNGSGSFADIGSGGGYDSGHLGVSNQEWPMVILAPQADGTA